MRFAFLLDAYGPYANANTMCADTIIGDLLKKGHLVDVYTIRDGEEQENVEFENGLKVFYFDNAYTQKKRKLSERNKPLLPVQRFLLSVYNYLKRLKYEFFSNYWPDTIDMRSIIKYFQIQNSALKYDVIIAFCYPFSFAKLALKLNKIEPTSKRVQYMLDPFVYNYTLSAKKVKKRKKQFKKYMSGADKIFITRGIEEENRRRKYLNGFENKSVTVDLPNLIKPTRYYKDCPLPQEKIKCTYCGTFYEDIRNPDKMLIVLSEIESDIIVTIIGRGCEKAVEKYIEKFPQRFVSKNFMPHEQAMEYLESSNILINLGNTIPNQTPSKVFEYIASGKPVINFYSNENDTSLYYFDKYPLAFNFNLSNYSKQDIIDLEKFINANRSKKITFEEATQKLTDCLSENVVKKIVDELIRLK